MGVQWRTCSAARTDYLDSWHSLRRHVRVWLSLWLRVVHGNPVVLAISACFCLDLCLFDSSSFCLWFYIISPSLVLLSFLLSLFFFAKKSAVHCKNSLCNSCPSIKRETGFLAGHLNSNPVALASSERERERKGWREGERKKEKEGERLSRLLEFTQMLPT